MKILLLPHGPTCLMTLPFCGRSRKTLLQLLPYIDATGVAAVGYAGVIGLSDTFYHGLFRQ